VLAATHLRTMACFTQLAQAAGCVNLNVGGNLTRP